MVWHSVTIPCCHIGKVSLAVVRDKETGILIFVEWGCSSMLLSFRKCTREKLLELAPHEELCSFLHREKYRFPIWHSALGSPTTCHHQPKWLSFQLAHQTNVVLWAIPGKKYLCAYNQHFLTPIGFWKLKKKPHQTSITNTLNEEYSPSLLQARDMLPELRIRWIPRQ